MAAKWIPQAILSSRDDGYDVQFEELKGNKFVCRKCSYNIRRDDARVFIVSTAVKHLNCHQEDGHRIDPKAMQMLESRL